MTNPFAHDSLSNAQQDFSFDTDQGIPERHLVSFAAAMGAPRSTLGEQDYRYPAARQGGREELPAEKSSGQVKPWQAPSQVQPGYYPRSNVT